MKFYEVWVATQQYHGSTPLTYQSPDLYKPGDVVEVPLKNRIFTAIIYKQLAGQPKFKSKTILRKIDGNIGQGLELLLWLLRYYPGPSGIIANLFVPQGFPKKIYASPLATTASIKPIQQSDTKEQSQALSELNKLAPGKTALLHGETGTGKTRVYIKLANQVVSSGKSAIILTPEIGLTPQLVNMFEEVFRGYVVTLHSKITVARRRELWSQIALSKHPVIIIGPRSALFAPVKNLGLIVVDEAHDNSYKQDQTPHYHATRVAAKLASLHGAICILGTATPSISDYYSLVKNQAPVIRMTEPVNQISKPKITIVDHRHKEAFARSYIFSEAMINGIGRAIGRKEQSLIFLNRRGTARVVVCENCGWEAQCPNCDIPLAYHKDQHSLRCHVCNYSAPVPTSCPICHHTDLLFKTAGSKALWDELQKLFPDARIQRFDSDNKPAEALSQYYKAIKKGDVDILVGTQILAKGLDIPRLTFVGIPYADSSLYLPDFTADEQTYQLLSQVIGRVGRRQLASRIVVQSYSPENPVIQDALSKNWDSFYKTQLSQRREFSLPPFVYLLKLTLSKKRASLAENGAKELASRLQSQHSSLTILGPTPAFYGKALGHFNWQIVVKAKKRESLLRIISELPVGWRFDIDPVNLL